MGVHHEPNELSGQFCGPAKAHGPGGGHTPVGGCHLGSLLRANLSKDSDTFNQFSSPAAALLVAGSEMTQL